MATVLILAGATLAGVVPGAGYLFATVHRGYREAQRRAAELAALSARSQTAGQRSPGGFATQ